MISNSALSTVIHTPLNQSYLSKEKGGCYQINTTVNGVYPWEVIQSADPKLWPPLGKKIY